MAGRVKSGDKSPGPPRPQLNRMHTPVALSFRRAVPGGAFCLSHCGKDDVREVVDCLRQVTTMTWQQVLQTAGKGENKAGLAFTPYRDEDLKKVSRPLWLDGDVKIAGLRASQSIRVFGAYLDHTFYVLWFDPNHDIVPINKNYG